MTRLAHFQNCTGTITQSIFTKTVSFNKTVYTEILPTVVCYYELYFISVVFFIAKFCIQMTFCIYIYFLKSKAGIMNMNECKISLLILKKIILNLKSSTIGLLL